MRPDGTELEGWVSRQRDEAARDGLVVYFGGRSENVAWACDMASTCPGWDFVAFNHRGFGGSQGSTTEKTMLGDARAVFQWSREKLMSGASRQLPVVLVGRSLGTVAAVRVAAEFEVDGIALLSPLDSLISVVKGVKMVAPASFLLKYRMDAVSFGPAVRCPSLTLLTDGDSVVRNRNSMRLWESLGGEKQVRKLPRVPHRSFPRDERVQRELSSFLAQMSCSRRATV